MIVYAKFGVSFHGLKKNHISQIIDMQYLIEKLLRLHFDHRLEGDIEVELEETAGEEEKR